MPGPIQLSVVTPTLNSIRTIRETLASVARQDYPHAEHIVVDGGSTDGTIEVLRNWPRLRWISEKDEGHYHAMNKGIQMAQGDAVGILNADDCYCEGILRKVAAALEANAKWDALFGDFIFVDGAGREIYRRQEACWDPQVVRFGFGMALHQALFVRKKTYDRLGLLRHKDFKNACDMEFLMRMAQAKCRVGHIREYVVLYRYHQYGQSADQRIVANMGQETARIRREYGVPGGWRGRLLFHYARAKRQAQKLLLLGKCDLVPGRWLLRKHMQQRTEFSSNIELDKL
ncbi:MAG TPA: glycosyltransferase family 2 protein [Candidatus Paceibacterota bacterium]|nr:glycosyltransferase family 2 protein [Candidatus Paceibacterota bacterium]